MPIELTLTCQDGKVVSTYQGQLLANPMPLTALPRITEDENPYRYDPVIPGRKLLEAMGGQKLLDLLDDDPEGLLLLITDETSATIPWEYAATPTGIFLVTDYGCLRLLPESRSVPPAQPGPLNFVIMAADPLVNEAGLPRTGYKLDIENELREIGRVLDESHTRLTAGRIPPTKQHLRGALKTGPAILHLSAHGSVIALEHEGQVTRQAVLYLEDATGREDPLRGDHLLRMPPRGVLRLIVFSACRTAASAMDASLARAMVQAGTPAAIGMQGDFPDPLSDELAATLYDFLLNGHDLAESLRQARQAMSHVPYAVGLPVAYVSPNGWQALPRQVGQPQVAALTQPHPLNVPPALVVPKPFMGREWELHQLAGHFEQRHQVITVVGSGGIGKTALSAAFAARFGWRFPGGVIGLTLANRPSLAPKVLFRELLERLSGGPLPSELADAPAERLVELFLQAARSRPPLIVLDNYESVLQLTDPNTDSNEEGPDEKQETGNPATHPEAKTAHVADALRFHRDVFSLAKAGLPLLLTSRHQPAGLPGEIIFPDRGLAGMMVKAGAALFIYQSSRAKKESKHHLKLAEDVARATSGHPLAITLLAAEFDASDPKSPEDFLDTWTDELEAAQHAGLPPHQATFAVAFDRSFQHLARRQQRQLLALSFFPAPFFAEGAALLWQALEPAAQGEDEAQQAGVGDELATFTHRSLLRVEGYFEEGQPATYRLEPVIARHLDRLRPPEWASALAPAYAAYAGWLVNRVYGETGRSPALAQLTQQWLDELIPLAGAQPPQKQAGYCWQLGALLESFGRLGEALEVLGLGEQAARATGNEAMLSRIMYGQANISVTRGDLNQALDLYQQTLTILEQVGDLQGKGATLANMAQVYLTRGDLNQALDLYQQSLTIREQVGDLQGKGATLHNMAQVYLTRGDLNQALDLYQQSLTIREQVGDLQGKGATLHNMAQVYLTRGDLNQALDLYQQSLTIREQVGDLKGKGATLANMAQVYLTRGDLNQALDLYQQTLTILEQVGDLQGKGATLANMAQVYLTRGDLNQALDLYQQSLTIREQVGDLKGKGATLANMAQVYLTRGDLNQALDLYQQTLTILEQVGDLQGKGATLHNMAQVYLTRGDLNQALDLYQQSLTIREQVGDLKGKGATLSGLANIFMARKNWDEAEKMVQEALAISQKLADMSGIAFKTVKLGQVAQARGDRVTARQHYQAGLALFERLGMPEAGQVRQMLAQLAAGPQPEQPRTATVQEILLALTQAAEEATAGHSLAQAIEPFIEQADLPAGYGPYLEALAAAARQDPPGPAQLETLRQTAVVLVDNWQDTLSADTPTPLHTPFHLLSRLTRLFNRYRQPQVAAQFQERAIACLRRQAETPDTLQTLSVALYNYAGYLGQLDRFDEAVAALEEVVAIDERLGLSDLETDRAALEQMKRRRDGLPPLTTVAAESDQRHEGQIAAAFIAQLESQLAGLPPEARAAAQQLHDHLSGLSPAEQDAMVEAMQQQAFQQQADSIVSAVRQAHQQHKLPQLIPQLEEAAHHFAQDEVEGSPFHQLAGFVQAVIALLRGEPLPPVPAAYAQRFAALQRDLQA